MAQERGKRRRWLMPDGVRARRWLAQWAVLLLAAATAVVAASHPPVFAESSAAVDGVHGAVDELGPDLHVRAP